MIWSVLNLMQYFTSRTFRNVNYVSLLSKVLMDCTVNLVIVESENLCENIRFLTILAGKELLSWTGYLMEKEGQAHVSQYRTFTRLKKVRIWVPSWLETEECIFKSQPFLSNTICSLFCSLSVNLHWNFESYFSSVWT